MRREQQAKRRRGTRQGKVARNVYLPLPLRGVHAQAAKGMVNNLFAVDLHNFRSTGHSLVLRPPVSAVTAAPGVIWRIPYEFGPGCYIEVTPGRMRCGNATMVRRNGRRPMHAALSSNVVIVDGQADPVRYDGTSFLPAAYNPPDGVALRDLDGIAAHNDRPFLWKRGGPLEFFYGEVGGVGGRLQRFPLGRLGNITGSIAAIRSLTVDAGHGMNDALCILTTTGQAVVYEGLNPGDPDDWRLLGRFQAAAPVDEHAFVQIGADVWMLTAQGVVSIGESLRSSLLALVSDVARPLMQVILDEVHAGPADWQGHVAGDGSMILLNRVRNGVARQFVFYVESQAWHTTDYPALCWHNLGMVPQFTRMDGALCTVGGEPGEPVVARWSSSWFTMPDTTQIVSLKPMFSASGPVTVTLTVLADYNETAGDIAEARQVMTVRSDRPGGGIADAIIVGQVGQAFRIIMEIEAEWIEMTSIVASVV